jgi:hypothetical protein
MYADTIAAFEQDVREAIRGCQPQPTVTKKGGSQVIPDEVGQRLKQCKGYRVLDDGGALGVVTDLVYRTHPDIPDQIVVRSGLLQHHVLKIPTERVVECNEQRKQLLLKAGAR